MLKNEFEIVVASCGGHPKDISLYQAQKGLNLASRAAKHGGKILLLAAAPQGAGDAAYLDYVSSRWAAPSENQNWEGLKALVPLALTDGTTLDAILGRLVGLRVQQLSDEDLDEAIRICTESLATGRPWD